MKDGISIIICTYNPEKDIFERILKALVDAELNSIGYFENIIIDNNSLFPLEHEEYIQKFLKNTPNSTVFIEKRQGLTQARKRGITEARCKWILFIDDDNEIDKDYIIQIKNVCNTYPDLAAFNAGVIRVKFLGDVKKWFENIGKSHFQESNIQETIVGKDTKTFGHWPFGTGLIVTKEVCDYYVKKLDRGLYTLTDRNGKMLMSGGDGQLVACAIEMGYSIGRAKELKLNHLIAARKATMSYLRKIDYGIYFSGELFTKESLPDNTHTFSTLQEVRMFINTFVIGGCKAILKNDFNKYSLQRASLLGRLNGNRLASGKKTSWFLSMLSKRYSS